MNYSTKLSRIAWRISRGLKERLRRFLASYGLILVSEARLLRTQRQYETVLQLLSEHDLSPCETEAAVLGVVFSKDRPLQLDGLLTSYKHMVADPKPPISVLYTASSEAFDAGYSKLIRKWANEEGVSFICEREFRTDLIKILEQDRSPFVFFLVDDLIFIRKVNFHELLRQADGLCIPSLRLGSNLSFCYTAQQHQPRPPFSKKRDLLEWDWGRGKYDWGYPLSVDGNIFAMKEIRAMTKVLDFKAPNSFEDALQDFLSAFLKRRGLCYQHSAVVNMPLNKVQTENSNISRDMDAEDLLADWMAGAVMDVERYQDAQIESAHSELPLFVVTNDRWKSD